MKALDWIKIVAAAVFIEVALVALSILEVFVWSSLQYPQPGMPACTAHANLIGPPLSAIFGALFMYLFTANYIKKNRENRLVYAIGLPTAYLIVDVAILLFYPINWLEHLPILVAASAPKYGGALLAYYKLGKKSGLATEYTETEKAKTAVEV